MDDQQSPPPPPHHYHPSSSLQTQSYVSSTPPQNSPKPTRTHPIPSMPLPAVPNYTPHPRNPRPTSPTVSSPRHRTAVPSPRTSPIAYTPPPSCAWPRRPAAISYRGVPSAPVEFRRILPMPGRVRSRGGARSRIRAWRGGCDVRWGLGLECTCRRLRVRVCVYWRRGVVRWYYCRRRGRRRRCGRCRYYCGSCCYCSFYLRKKRL
mmetsp:Transcript_23568/g.42344  ORF Transcript_23568/g.42344 Transcript_23568/m.42344 type:complete len:206 (-) Transcript_23568:413-1030(-)